MEDVIKTDQDRESIKKELLTLLLKLESEGWEILAWSHMHTEKLRCLDEPQKLTECEYYHVIKSWLIGGMVMPHESNQEGLVRYDGLEKTEEGKAFVESVFFALWLVKDQVICIVTYGAHKFNNKIFEGALGRASYSIVVKDSKETLLQFMRN